MTVVAIEHIDLDSKGVARIAGTRTKVIHLVMDKMANGWSPEELHAQYPHLTLAQIHAAFAYYYDHQAALDVEIQQDIQHAEKMRKATDQSDIVGKLRAQDNAP